MCVCACVCPSSSLSLAWNKPNRLCYLASLRINPASVSGTSALQCKHSTKWAMPLVLQRLFFHNLFGLYVKDFRSRDKPGVLQAADYESVHRSPGLLEDEALLCVTSHHTSYFRKGATPDCLSLSPSPLWFQGVEMEKYRGTQSIFPLLPLNHLAKYSCCLLSVPILV